MLINIEISHELTFQLLISEVEIRTFKQTIFAIHYNSLYYPTTIYNSLPFQLTDADGENLAIISQSL